MGKLQYTYTFRPQMFWFQNSDGELERVHEEILLSIERC